MDNHLFHKLPQECWGQFGVLLDNIQKALDIDRLGFGGGYNILQFLYRLFQSGLFLFVALRQLGKPLCAQCPCDTILIKPLNNGIQFMVQAISDPGYDIMFRPASW